MNTRNIISKTNPGTSNPPFPITLLLLLTKTILQTDFILQEINTDYHTTTTALKIKKINVI